MRLPLLLGSLVATALLAPTLYAKIAFIPSIPERTVKADLVVTGKVVKIEDTTVSVQRPGTKENVEYQIAVVKIDDPIHNAKDLTHVRVGFLPNGGQPLALQVDQEALLFLSAVPGQSFYVAPGRFDIVDKKAADFEATVKEAKTCGKLLADSDAGLKAKDANERLLTAFMLITRYSTQSADATKQEPIDAAQSKLLLQTLADLDWPQLDRRSYVGVNPIAVFSKLNLTPKDGWTPPATAADFPTDAKKWLKDNAGTYRIRRWVPEKSDTKG